MSARLWRRGTLVASLSTTVSVSFAFSRSTSTPEAWQCGVVSIQSTEHQNLRESSLKRQPQQLGNDLINLRDIVC
jgi:hypothetical protein